MKQAHVLNQRWIAPVVGTVLIVIGCCQLVYSTLLVAAAIGFALIGGLLSAGGELISGEPGDDGSGEARVAMIMAQVGYGLAIFAVVAAVLMLRNHRLAFYFIGLFIGFCFLLAACHLMIPWYAFTVIYGVIGLLFTALLIARWRLQGSLSFDAPAKE
jgi:hypothetical protein